MQRRRFLTSSLAASLTPSLAASLATTSEAQTGSMQTASSKSQEFYLLRQYRMQMGAQTKLTESYFSNALLPALTRMGIGPVGAFRVEIGPETPTYYLLIPGSSAETLATLDLLLATDAVFLKAAEPFWNAPATAPAFVRVESSLLSAFTGWPHLTPPPGAKASGVFQLRTYESPTWQDHVRKVEMFNNGEFDIFTHSGFHSVFYGDTLIGPRMPSLTYMLHAASQNELNLFWDKFRDDPDWKKLSTAPRYSFEELVSSITNLILSPLPMSEI